MTPRLFRPSGARRRPLGWLAALLLPLCLGASAAQPLRIGISVSDLGNPFFVQIARGAEAEARQLAGDAVAVQVVSSAYDYRRQVAQIDAFVAQGVDMILLAAARFEGVAEAIARARAAGVKVLAVDVNAQGADATVTTDNVQAGEIACDYLAGRLQGRGQVVIINGPPVSSVQERVSGCLKVLARYPQIRVLSSDRNGGGSRDGGLEVMTYLLTAHPEIDGVFAINDPSAIGAEQAARQAGRDDFVIVGVDGAPAAVARLRDPDSLLRATAAQFPNRMAATAVALGYRLMQGEALAQPRVLIPAELVTPENLDAYPGW